MLLLRSSFARVRFAICKIQLDFYLLSNVFNNVLVVSCGEEPRIGNATIVEQKVSELFGSKVTHMCPVGYGKDGGHENTIVTSCNGDGTWSDTESACLSKSLNFI